MRRRHRGGGNFGLFLLVFQLINFFTYLSARNEFLPATIGILVVNVAAFLRPHVGRSFHWPSIDDSCISLDRVVFRGEWIRVVFAPFVHADSWHLYYNMASFIWKARTLEKHYGSGYFLYLVSVFTVLTSLLYVAINYLIAELFNSYSAAFSCAVGFSGVIFAVKVLTTHLQPAGMSYIMGIPVPKRLAVWAELILISVLVPRASFVGHLAGILVGLAFVGGPLKQLMDFPQLLLQGRGVPLNLPTGRQSYTYTAQPSGRRDDTARSHDEEEDMDEAVRRSLANTRTHANSSRDDDGHSSEQRSYSYTAQPSGWRESQIREDQELQEAIHRSLADSESSGELHSSSKRIVHQRPPPYNPGYVEEEEGLAGQQYERSPHFSNASVEGSHDIFHHGEHSHSSQNIREARLKRFDRRY